MITDIPRPKDFENTGISLLSIAWENAVQLSLSLQDAKTYGVKKSREKRYWQSAQTELATSIALVQQAVEFLLKARIVSVSPYLLISGTPREWPKGCNLKDTVFADFYSIDAQDIVRTHDAVAHARLPVEMVVLFEKMRKLRNRIVHTIDKTLTVDVKEVIVAVLQISDWFFGPKQWLIVRRNKIENSPDATIYGGADNVALYSLAREVLNVVGVLGEADVQRFFGFSKKARRYICPNCALLCADFDLLPNLAFLVPNTPTSNRVFCSICFQEASVLRENCGEDDCKGNVLSAEDKCCLTCYR
ncbi:MAG: hypothetical protein ACO1QS_02675 [Verrucomicrobiota bacterium]